MTKEILEIFDENSNFLGTEKRSVIHSNGLFHRTVSIFIIDSKQRIFLQQRSGKKDVCPLRWDLSAAEHLKPKETYESAAQRCLKEELNIEPVIKKIRDMHLQKNEYFEGKIKDYEFVELYLGACSGEINFNTDEVFNGKFANISDIDKTMTENPDNFTPWFADEWKYMKSQGLLFQLDKFFKF